MQASQDPSRTAVPFTDLLDLMSEKMGGSALFTNDDFFAPMGNLVKAAPAVFIADKYTEFGKWMDGWESRRKRNLGPGNDHDWCVLKLGAPGVIHGVDVDTAHFTGNFPESCAIDACFSETELDPAAVSKTRWTEIVSRTRLLGGTRNLIPVSDRSRFTHLRLQIFPDGGVARLRVHGEAKGDLSQAAKSGGLVDLGAAVSGAIVVACNDMYFGQKENLILPGRAKTMGEGWETRRRRGPGSDWIVVRLAATGKLQKIEVDTHHYKGNFPESCMLEVLSHPARDLDAASLRDRTDLSWKELVPRTKLQADHAHVFEPKGAQACDYVKLTIFPDGGISRLRLWGTPE
jgi:allantoicase